MKTLLPLLLLSCSSEEPRSLPPIPKEAPCKRIFRRALMDIYRCDLDGVVCVVVDGERTSDVSCVPHDTVPGALRRP